MADVSTPSTQEPRDSVVARLVHRASRFTPARVLRALRGRLRRPRPDAVEPTASSAPPAPAPGSPRGAIDSPDLHATLERGPMAFSGWALVGRARASAAVLVVNEQLRVDVELGQPRPDVPVGLGEEDAAVDGGWRAEVDLRTLPPGEARLQLFVRPEDEAATWECVADRVHPLRGHGITGNVDAPADGACVVGELLVVTGWAHTPRTINSVEVECGGRLLGLARLGIGRLDVESPATGVGPLCGFEFRGVVEAVGDGPQVVSVVATDLDGSRAVLGVRRLHFLPHEPTADELAYGERLRALNCESVRHVAATARRDPRRVLAFTHSLSLGGGQLYLQDLIREILPHLDGLTVMTPVGGVLGPELESMGADVVISGRGWAYDIASYEGHIRELQHLIVGSGCGVVLVNTLGQFAAADAAQRVGVPTIWALHESMEVADWIERNSVGTPVSAYVHSRIEAALRGATRLVFEADATRRLYLKVTGAPERAVTVNYAVDVEAIDEHVRQGTRAALRASNGIPEEAVVLLNVGVFEERKSQGCLIEAFVRVADVHPEAVLVLVGDHPCPHAAALHRAVPPGVADRVRFVPITPEIWNWYQMADVLVSASDVESLPRSMLESMLFECPVLSVSVFGIPELIRDGENGWLVEERDMASLVAGFHRVLRLDREAWALAGLKGREIVLDQYRSDRFGDAYLRMIEALAPA